MKIKWCQRELTYTLFYIIPKVNFFFIYLYGTEIQTAQWIDNKFSKHILRSPGKV